MTLAAALFRRQRRQRVADTGYVRPGQMRRADSDPAALDLEIEALLERDAG